MSILYLPVVCHYAPYRADATAMALRLEQPFLDAVDPILINDADFVLLYSERGIALQQTGKKAQGPVSAEFTEGAADHRRKFGGGKGQMIAKAVGLKAGVYPQVLDATAGLGRDAFVLATLGCEVLLLERSPVVHALLASGLARAQEFSIHQDAELAQVLARMHLIANDSRNYLEQLSEDQRPDVIYLDPMFPGRDKAADVKKEMKAFHSIVGKDEDADQLLTTALAKARYRVVVKRPRKSPFVGDQKPSYQLEGKSSRYDIYTVAKLPDKLPLAN